MKSQFLIYAIGAGLNRGLPVLLAPLIVSEYGVEGFGIWSLSYLAGSLLTNLLCFGGGNGVLRAASERDWHSSAYALLLARDYTWVVLITCAVGIGLIYFLALPIWYAHTIMIGAAFACLELVSSWARGRNNMTLYSAMVLMRLSVIAGGLVFAVHAGGNVYNLIKVQGLLASIFCVALILAITITAGVSKLRVQQDLRFSIPFVFHACAQWVLSSADRFIVNAFWGAEAAGIYSIWYALASLPLLVTSVVTLLLPSYVIQNFQSWSYGREAEVWLLRYIYAGLVLYVFSLIALFTITALGYLDVDILMGGLISISMITLGQLFLGLYAFSVPWLFKLKLSERIASISLRTCTFSLVVFVGAIYYAGLVGGAAATLITYVLYSWLTMLEVRKALPEIVFHPAGPMAACVGAYIIIIFSTIYFTKFYLPQSDVLTFLPYKFSIVE
ncbi:hypothetical protein N9H49_04745 [Luminiphilus sp.]|nr:hypothetical protein [Luminiphilus sp.]